MKVQAGEIFVSAAGRATEVLATLEPDDPPDWQRTVAGWFLQCPGQSPAWQHYGLAIMHLRPIEGVKPAIIIRLGATHEVMLVAYDPEQRPNPEDPRTWSPLRPFNFVGQLTLPSDGEAKKIIGILAKAVADGFLWAEPPLSGQSEPWESQLRQLEDHAAGKHHHS